MSGVRLDHVTKTYGHGVMAVRDVTLAARDGELLALVGPSGCGKTTLLRCIAGLERPDAGRIFIGDERVDTLPPQPRDVALVFQHHALFPHLSVADNLAFSLRMRRVPRPERQARVQEVAATLGLTDVLERRPRALSGGQRQRVAVGRALAHTPRVFLFDEPLSNLDAQLRVQLRAEIVALQRRLGITMIYVTHDQGEALTMGDRIGVLGEGTVQQVAAPQTLYDRPANRFVAAFLGSPAMNLIDGAVEGGAFVTDGLRLPLPERLAGAATRGQAVTLGIRPEAVRLAEAAPHHAGPLRARVTTAEWAGHEALIRAEMHGHALAARVAPERLPAPGGALTLDLPADRLYLFDAATGAVLATPPDVSS